MAPKDDVWLRNEFKWGGGLMPRMRTIEQAAAYVHEKDRQSALTKTAIRRLVITGIIPSCKIGSKYLLDLDKLEETLAEGTTVIEQPGRIRRVS